MLALCEYIQLPKARAGTQISTAFVGTLSARLVLVHQVHMALGMLGVWKWFHVALSLASDHPHPQVALSHSVLIGPTQVESPPLHPLLWARADGVDNTHFPALSPASLGKSALSIEGGLSPGQEYQTRAQNPLYHVLGEAMRSAICLPSSCPQTLETGAEGKARQSPLLGSEAPGIWVPG